MTELLNQFQGAVEYLRNDRTLQTLIFLAALVYPLPVQALYVIIENSPAELGSSCSITCSTRETSKVGKIYLMSLMDRVSYSLIVQVKDLWTTTVVTNGPLWSSRFAYSYTGSGVDPDQFDVTLTLNISKLRCDDVRKIRCTAGYCVHYGAPLEFKYGTDEPLDQYECGHIHEEMRFLIKVVPSSPYEVSSKPSSLLTEKYVQAGPNVISAKAGLGLPGYESIFVWRYFFGDRTETRKRLSDGVTSETKVRECFVELLTTLTVNVSKEWPDFAASLFISGDSWGFFTIPDHCPDPVEELCWTSPRVKVGWRVENSTVNVLAREDDSGQVSLTCQADGRPTPTYRWVKVTWQRKKMHLHTVNETSRYVTRRQEESTDAEEFRCIATNQFGRSTFTAWSSPVILQPLRLLRPSVSHQNGNVSGDTTKKTTTTSRPGSTTVGRETRARRSLSREADLSMAILLLCATLAPALSIYTIYGHLTTLPIVHQPGYHAGVTTPQQVKVKGETSPSPSKPPASQTTPEVKGEGSPGLEPPPSQSLLQPTA